MPFTREVVPRFHQLDPAGIVFFGAVFALSSDVYEDFIQSLGFTWNEWFQSDTLLSPIRHAEADYLKPLEGGQRYAVNVEILSLGDSSFTMGFQFSAGEVTHCRVRIVHVFLDASTYAKMAIPARVRAAFEVFGVAQKKESLPPAHG